jgi:uncharacterized membrane protein
MVQVNEYVRELIERVVRVFNIHKWVHVTMILFTLTIIFDVVALVNQQEVLVSTFLVRR